MNPDRAQEVLDYVNKLSTVRSAHWEADVLVVKTWPIRANGHALGCYTLRLGYRHPYMDIRNTTRAVDDDYFYHPRIYKLRDKSSKICLPHNGVDTQILNFFCRGQLEFALLALLDFLKLSYYNDGITDTHLLQMFPKIKLRMRKKPPYKESA